MVFVQMMLRLAHSLVLAQLDSRDQHVKSHHVHLPHVKMVEHVLLMDQGMCAHAQQASLVRTVR